jgi:hypothetical protein
MAHAPARLLLPPPLLLLLLLGAQTCSCQAASDRLSPLLPPQGCWVGSSIDYPAWQSDLRAYSDALGFVPASWVLFVALPLTPGDVQRLDAVLPQIARLNGIAIITAEPHGGLGPTALTEAQVLELAALIRKYEAQGLKVVVRYAHEANGSWYPWWGPGLTPARPCLPACSTP